MYWITIEYTVYVKRLLVGLWDVFFMMDLSKSYTDLYHLKCSRRLIYVSKIQDSRIVGVHAVGLACTVRWLGVCPQIWPATKLRVMCGGTCTTLPGLFTPCSPILPGPADHSMPCAVLLPSSNYSPLLDASTTSVFLKFCTFFGRHCYWSLCMH